jgi:hypothetical protein
MDKPDFLIVWDAAVLRISDGRCSAAPGFCLVR